MKQILRLTLVLTLVAIVFGSCKKATFITPSQQEVQFTKTGGEQQLVVSTDGSWSVENCPEWLNAERADSMLVLKVEPNTTGAPRECEIQLVGGDGVKATVVVKQADVCTHIDPTVNEVTIPKEGGTTTIDIDTDGAHLEIIVSEGISAEFNNGTLSVTAPANEGGTKHESLTISCDNIKTEVNVTVEGSICPTCNGTGKIRCPNCHGKGWYPTNVGGGGAPCKRCGGFWCSNDLVEDFEEGSGRIKCPDCGGTGH